MAILRFFWKMSKKVKTFLFLLKNRNSEKRKHHHHGKLKVQTLYYWSIKNRDDEGYQGSQYTQ